MSLAFSIPADVPALVTGAQLARLLGVCDKTLRRWVQRGWLPAPAQLNRRVHLHNTSAVRAALERRERGWGDAPRKATKRV